MCGLKKKVKSFDLFTLNGRHVTQYNRIKILNDSHIGNYQKDLLRNAIKKIDSAKEKQWDE